MLRFFGAVAEFFERSVKYIEQHPLLMTIVVAFVGFVLKTVLIDPLRSRPKKGGGERFVMEGGLTIIIPKNAPDYFIAMLEYIKQRDFENALRYGRKAEEQQSKSAGDSNEDMCKPPPILQKNDSKDMKNYEYLPLILISA